MIYVFNFAKDVCALPGQACLLCAEACGRLGELSCTPVQRVLEEAARLSAAAGRFFAGFVERPLSTYVLVKVVLSLAGLRSCVAALLEPSLGACHERSWIGIRAWLHMQIGFACLHLLFAPYLQSQVWHLVVVQTGDLKPSNKGTIKIPAERVHDSFQIVLVHDIVVCLYVVVLTVSFVWSYWGMSVVELEGCNPGGWPEQACQLGMYFPWVALLYVSCYYFCGCCASSVELRASALPGGLQPSAPPLAGGAAGAFEPSAPPLAGFPAQPSKQPACLATPDVQAHTGLAAPVVAGGWSQRGRGSTFKTPLSCLCAFLLPPLGVFWRFGCGKHLIVTILLTCLGYLPGFIYACIVIACESPGEAAARESRDEEALGAYIAIE